MILDRGYQGGPLEGFWNAPIIRYQVLFWITGVAPRGPIATAVPQLYSGIAYASKIGNSKLILGEFGWSDNFVSQDAEHRLNVVTGTGSCDLRYYARSSERWMGVFKPIDGGRDARVT